MLFQNNDLNFIKAIITSLDLRRANGGGGTSMPVGTYYGDYLVWDGATYISEGAKVCIGSFAGQTNQSANSVAIGYQSGNFNQSTYAVSIGYQAGFSNQSSSTVAIGYQSGQTDQGYGCIAAGFQAGQINQGLNSIAIGFQSGQTNQGQGAVAIGYQSGRVSQNVSSVAIGNQTGTTNQGSYALAIGYQAGTINQRANCVAIGNIAGNMNQGTNSIAIGNNAGNQNQRGNSIAIGTQSGQTGQGTNAIAIGYLAGQTNQPTNSIVLNATGSVVNGATANAFYVAPIRNVANSTNLLGYDNTNKEVFYTNKTFIIQHPNEENKYLVHACLEGPESGVYYRGIGQITNGKFTEIILPEYTNAFSDFTINVTQICSKNDVDTQEPVLLMSSSVENNSFNVYGKNCKFNWVAFGARNYFNVEPRKDEINVKGAGPYKWFE